MKRLALLTIASALLGASLLAPTAQASPRSTPLAGSPLRFTFVRYDPPGDDLPITNHKLNAEFVVIYNPTSATRTLTGFSVHDLGPDHTYHFGTFNLGPKRAITLHTGKGTKNFYNRFMGLDHYVWNNDGDTAFLVSKIGVTVDTCHWDDDGTGGIRC